jgi:hypothetical protein
MKMTASKVRENIYRILDEIIESGRPVEIKRKGRILKIVSEEPVKKTSRLIQRNIIRGRAEDLVHIDWSNEWKPE